MLDRLLSEFQSRVVALWKPNVNEKRIDGSNILEKVQGLSQRLATSLERDQVLLDQWGEPLEKLKVS